MNRVIKFRGKRLDNGEWCYGYYTYVNDTHTIHWENENGAPWWADVDPKTIGQFSGLCDIHDHEIYEGDIVVCDRIPPEIVSFKDGRFVTIPEDKPYRDTGLIVSTSSKSCVIIGNIYDEYETAN